MTTQVIVDILTDFCNLYSGPPWRITSDGGSNLASSAVADWCKRNNVIHSISATKCAESNSEAESCVKHAKLHILKCAYKGKTDWESRLCTLNQMQRSNGSGSAAELFFKRRTRVMSLPTIPHVESGQDLEKNEM